MDLDLTKTHPYGAGGILGGVAEGAQQGAWGQGASLSSASAVQQAVAVATSLGKRNALAQDALAAKGGKVRFARNTKCCVCEAQGLIQDAV